MEDIVPISVLLGITGGKYKPLFHIVPLQVLYPFTISDTHLIPLFHLINYS